MKKILIYNRILEYGGVSEVSIRLNEGLTDNSKDSTLVTIRNDRNYNKATIMKVNGCLNELLELIKIINNNNYNVVIINASIHVLFIKIYSFFTLKRIKIITTIHMRPKFWLLKKTINNRITGFMTLIGVKLSDKVVAVSNDLKGEIIEKGFINKDKIHSIYNPIVDKPISRHSYKDIEKKEIVDIAIIGWITKLKGQQIVVEALKNDKRYRLNIIGGVGEQEYYEELITKINDYDMKSQVKFWGEVSDVRSILRNMDIYILASESEALPTVLIEALECGVPIISNDCKWGPNEILKNGKYGTLYSRNNYNELSDKIHCLCNDNNIYNNFRMNSYERANDFTVQKSISKYMEII